MCFKDFHDTWYERYASAVLFRCPAATEWRKREFVRWVPDYSHLMYEYVLETITWKYILEKYQTFTEGIFRYNNAFCKNNSTSAKILFVFQLLAMGNEQTAQYIYEVLSRQHLQTWRRCEHRVISNKI